MATAGEPESVVITRAEFDQLRQWVYETHYVIMELRANVKPALDQIANGGILSAIMGRKGKP